MEGRHFAIKVKNTKIRFSQVETQKLMKSDHRLISTKRIYQMSESHVLE